MIVCHHAEVAEVYQCYDMQATNREGLAAHVRGRDMRWASLRCTRAMAAFFVASRLLGRCQSAGSISDLKLMFSYQLVMR